jgi:hypothetical protein
VHQLKGLAQHEKIGLYTEKCKKKVIMINLSFTVAFTWKDWEKSEKLQQFIVHAKTESKLDILYKENILIYSH